MALENLYPPLLLSKKRPATDTDPNDIELFNSILSKTKDDNCSSYIWNDLARCYSEGIGTKMSLTEAVRCAKKAVELDGSNKQAISFLAWCSYYGQGTSESPKTAFMYANSASKISGGTAVSSYILGSIYFQGLDFAPQDFTKSFNYINNACLNEGATSQMFTVLGHHYRDGYGHKVNYNKAAQFYEEALGKPLTFCDAWFNYGNVYLSNNQPKEALICYQIATKAQGRNKDIWIKLAGCYINGIGTEVNQNLAARCKANYELMLNGRPIEPINFFQVDNTGHESQLQSGKHIEAFQSNLRLAPINSTNNNNNNNNDTLDAVRETPKLLWPPVISNAERPTFLTQYARTQTSTNTGDNMAAFTQKKIKNLEEKLTACQNIIFSQDKALEEKNNEIRNLQQQLMTVNKPMSMSSVDEPMSQGFILEINQLRQENRQLRESLKNKENESDNTKYSARKTNRLN